MTRAAASFRPNYIISIYGRYDFGACLPGFYVGFLRVTTVQTAFVVAYIYILYTMSTALGRKYISSVYTSFRTAV